MSIDVVNELINTKLTLVGFEEGADVGFDESAEVGFEEGAEVGFEEGAEVGFEERIKLGNEVGSPVGLFDVGIVGL